MPLTAGERTLILSAGQSADQTVRGRAVATVLSKQGDEAEQARRLLAQSYVLATVPSLPFLLGVPEISVWRGTAPKDTP